MAKQTILLWIYQYDGINACSYPNTARGVEDALMDAAGDDIPEEEETRMRNGVFEEEFTSLQRGYPRPLFEISDIFNIDDGVLLIISVP